MRGGTPAGYRWTGLRAETHGPSRTTIQDVPLGANGTLIPITGVIGDNGIMASFGGNGIFQVAAETLFRVERDCDPIPRNGFCYDI